MARGVTSPTAGIVLAAYAPNVLYHTDNVMAAQVVVVIDDDVAMLGYLQVLLEEAGYRPVVSQDDARAAELIRGEQPAVVMLDLHVGHRYAGWTVLLQLRAEPRTADIPAILFTGNREFVLENRHALRELRADFLLKPFATDELLAKIAAAAG
ncbi:MAG: hypothetical protein AVDCRST_MAG26-3677 [uncultured Chloroflexia bacterium]|uniref:Response regulatory domain-containing protein n=1 Tax=uncultured Chloroflexia bacterium TaxID=1672391 RepID=A0A6J4JR07_9CHLR|nr:MAG: hypothetical protein AVDCRST_MAG26-3677 [uncultured Chloroflexia bacterium]